MLGSMRDLLPILLVILFFQFVVLQQPLPNIGGWYNYSPAKKWLIHARVDWISANIGDYDGSLWNASLGVAYQPWRHVGFDLYWQYFGVDLKVDKDSWKGGANMDYSGPVLGMTFTW